MRSVAPASTLTSYAKAADSAESVMREHHLELLLLPAAHHELIVAHSLQAVCDQGVRFEDQQLTATPVECRHSREGQLTSIGRHPLSEQRLAALALDRGAPVAHVHNEHAAGASALASAANTASRSPSSRISLRTPRHRIA